MLAFLAQVMSQPAIASNHITFATADHERRFKALLSKVPMSAKVWNEDGKCIIAVRPKNVASILEAADKYGAGDTFILGKIVKALNADPVLFIRFEHKILE